jgi:hypothetical protein
MSTCHRCVIPARLQSPHMNHVIHVSLREGIMSGIQSVLTTFFVEIATQVMFCYNERADAILNIENRVGSLNIGCARGLG